MDNATQIMNSRLLSLQVINGKQNYFLMSPALL